MRTVQVEEIRKAVKEMCIQANYFLSEDMKARLDQAAADEASPLGRQVLAQLQENLKIAGEDMIPICQDTGMAVVFLKVGQDVHLEGGGLTDADKIGRLSAQIRGWRPPGTGQHRGQYACRDPL